MFKLVKERTAWWPVSWMIPCEDLIDGKAHAEEAKVEMQFRLLGDEAYAALSDDGKKIDADFPDVSPSDRAAMLVMTFTVGWRGVCDDKGVALPFERETLADFVNLPGAVEAIAQAFRACRAGEGALRTKN